MSLKSTVPPGVYLIQASVIINIQIRIIKLANTYLENKHIQEFICSTLFNLISLVSIRFFSNTHLQKQIHFSRASKKKCIDSICVWSAAAQTYDLETLNLKSKHSLEIKLFPDLLHPLYNSGTIFETATNFDFTHVY